MDASADHRDGAGFPLQPDAAGAIDAPGGEAPDPSELPRRVRVRAENVYRCGGLRCTEAVLSVLNRAFRGELPDHLAVRLASGLPEGLGGGGCICGALNGGALAIGLFLGRDRPGFGNNRSVASATRELHDRFRKRFGSTCCRVLTRAVAYGSRAHFRHCAGLTGAAAEITAGILLERRPGLARRADPEELGRSESRIGACLRTMFHRTG